MKVIETRGFPFTQVNKLNQIECYIFETTENGKRTCVDELIHCELEISRITSIDSQMNWVVINKYGRIVDVLGINNMIVTIEQQQKNDLFSLVLYELKEFECVHLHTFTLNLGVDQNNQNIEANEVDEVKILRGSHSNQRIVFLSKDELQALSTFSFTQPISNFRLTDEYLILTTSTEVKILNISNLFTSERKQFNFDNDLIWQNSTKTGTYLDSFLFTSSHNHSSTIIVLVESSQLFLFSINLQPRSDHFLHCVCYCKFSFLTSSTTTTTTRPVSCICNSDSSSSYLSLHLLFDKHLDSWILPRPAVESLDESWFNQPKLLNRLSFNKKYSSATSSPNYSFSFLDCKLFLNHQIIWLFNGRIFVKLIESKHVIQYSSVNNMFDLEELLDENRNSSVLTNSIPQFGFLELEEYQPLSTACRSQLLQQFEHLKQNVINSVTNDEETKREAKEKEDKEQQQQYKQYKQIKNFNGLLSFLIFQGQQWLQLTETTIEENDFNHYNHHNYHYNHHRLLLDQKRMESLQTMRNFIIELSQLLVQSSQWLFQSSSNESNPQNILKVLQSMNICVKLSPLLKLQQINYLLKHYQNNNSNNNSTSSDQLTSLLILENILTILSDSIHPTVHLETFLSLLLDIFSTFFTLFKRHHQQASETTYFLFLEHFLRFLFVNNISWRDCSQQILDKVWLVLNKWNYNNNSSSSSLHNFWQHLIFLKLMTSIQPPPVEVGEITGENDSELENEMKLLSDSLKKIWSIDSTNRNHNQNQSQNQSQNSSMSDSFRVPTSTSIVLDYLTSNSLSNRSWRCVRLWFQGVLVNLFSTWNNDQQLNNNNQHNNDRNILCQLFREVFTTCLKFQSSFIFIDCLNLFLSSSLNLISNSQPTTLFLYDSWNEAQYPSEFICQLLLSCDVKSINQAIESKEYHQHVSTQLQPILTQPTQINFILSYYNFLPIKTFIQQQEQMKGIELINSPRLEWEYYIYSTITFFYLLNELTQASSSSQSFQSKKLLLLKPLFVSSTEEFKIQTHSNEEFQHILSFIQSFVSPNIPSSILEKILELCLQFFVFLVQHQSVQSDKQIFLQILTSLIDQQQQSSQLISVWFQFILCCLEGLLFLEENFNLETTDLVNNWEKHLHSLLLTLSTFFPLISFEFTSSFIHIVSYLSTISSFNSSSQPHYKKRCLLKWKIVLKVLYSFHSTSLIYKEIFEECLQLIITSHYCSRKDFINLLPSEMNDCSMVLSYLKLIK